MTQRGFGRTWIAAGALAALGACRAPARAALDSGPRAVVTGERARSYAVPREAVQEALERVLASAGWSVAERERPAVGAWRTTAVGPAETRFFPLVGRRTKRDELSVTLATTASGRASVALELVRCVHRGAPDPERATAVDAPGVERHPLAGAEPARAWFEALEEQLFERAGGGA